MIATMTAKTSHAVAEAGVAIDARAMKVTMIMLVAATSNTVLIPTASSVTSMMASLPISSLQLSLLKITHKQ